MAATRIEVIIQEDMLDRVEALARHFIGEPKIPIPPEMALILIAAYRDRLKALPPSPKG